MTKNNEVKWQVSNVSKTLSGVHKFELVRYLLYVCTEVDVCHNSSACNAYVMRVELDLSHYMHVSHFIHVCHFKCCSHRIMDIKRNCIPLKVT